MLVAHHQPKRPVPQLQVQVVVAHGAPLGHLVVDVHNAVGAIQNIRQLAFFLYLFQQSFYIGVRGRGFQAQKLFLGKGQPHVLQQPHAFSPPLGPLEIVRLVAGSARAAVHLHHIVAVLIQAELAPAQVGQPPARRHAVIHKVAPGAGLVHTAPKLHPGAGGRAGRFFQPEQGHAVLHGRGLQAPPGVIALKQHRFLAVCGNVIKPSIGQLVARFPGEQQGFALSIPVQVRVDPLHRGLVFLQKVKPAIHHPHLNQFARLGKDEVPGRRKAALLGQGRRQVNLGPCAGAVIPAAGHAGQVHLQVQLPAGARLVGRDGIAFPRSPGMLRVLLFKVVHAHAHAVRFPPPADLDIPVRGGAPVALRYGEPHRAVPLFQAGQQAVDRRLRVVPGGRVLFIAKRGN